MRKLGIQIPEWMKPKRLLLRGKALGIEFSDVNAEFKNQIMIMP